VWAIGQSGAGVEAQVGVLVCTALTPVLQDVAEVSCSAAGHKHAGFQRLSVCGTPRIPAAALHNKELAQPGRRARGCCGCWQDGG